MNNGAAPAATLSGSHRTCPLLERESPSRVVPYAPEPWVLRECLETGFVYLENPPGYQALVDDFAWEVTSQRETAARRTAEPLFDRAATAIKTARQRLLPRRKIPALVQALIRKASPGPIHILDVGCGWGGLLGDVVQDLPESLRRRCVLQGIEISRQLAAVSDESLRRSGGRCVNASAVEGMQQFPAASLSIIVMSSFLEHELQPLPLLRLCAEKLQSGGSIVVKVPNYGSVNRRVRGARWCGFRWPDHVNYFTPRTLRAMAERAGLIVGRMQLLDRQPLSDNMYAVLRKPA